MSTIVLKIVSENSGREEVLTAALAGELACIQGVEISNGPRLRNARYLHRVTALDVIATFVTSAVALELARALRDYVKRQKVSIEVVAKDGARIAIKAQGGKLPSAAKLASLLKPEEVPLNRRPRKRIPSTKGKTPSKIK